MEINMEFRCTGLDLGIKGLRCKGPNGITRSLIAVLAGLQIPFLCREMHELGEELVASYFYQVHFYYWLESDDYGGFLADDDLTSRATEKIGGDHRFRMRMEYFGGQATTACIRQNETGTREIACAPRVQRSKVQ